jgi:hypothetical protein
MTKSGKCLAVLATVIAIGGASAFLFFPSEDPGRAKASHEGPGSELAAVSEKEASPKHSSSAIDGDESKTFDQVKVEAEQGSAKAQRKLSEIYALCSAYSVDPRKQLAHMDYMAKLVPASRSGMDGVKKRLKARCDKVDFGQPIPFEAFTLWMEQAAKNGDVASKVKLRIMSTQELTAVEAEALVGETLTIGDPEALLEMSNLASRPVTGELPSRYQQLVGNPTAGAAWAAAACRSGASCGHGSMLMDSVCISTGRCNYRNYEEFITWETIPPAEKARMNSIASSILKMKAH